jgi:hypothetical protein
MSNENNSKTEDKIFRIIIKIFLVLIVVAVLAVGGVYLSAKSLITMMTEQDKSELTTLASAIPLVCTYNEMMANEADYHELLEFIEDVEDKSFECKGSMRKAVMCLFDAAEALSNPVAILEKTERLYRTQSKFKALTSRTLKRIEAIEPYDENSAGLKKEIVSMATYANKNSSAIDMVVNGEKIFAELERRFIAIRAGKNLETVIANFPEKYPDLIILGIANKIAPDITTEIVKSAVFSANDELTKTFMKSETFSRELNYGCLSGVPDAKLYPLIALLMTIDELTGKSDIL